MASLDIQVLGGLSLRRDGEPVPLPASRKTRALLAYLVVTTRPHRRDRLCELLWEIPDDPRAALRWSLSKLRSIVNDPEFDRIVADRERAEFAPHAADVDLHKIRDLLTSEDASEDVTRLYSLEEALREPLLDGVDLPEQPEFQQWLEAERALTRRLRAQAAALLSQHDQTPADQALDFAE
ncbi:MAG: alpha/beta hydrolase, partial [Pseudomonadota bacterium]